jgi:hypothetical protein
MTRRMRLAVALAAVVSMAVIGALNVAAATQGGGQPVLTPRHVLATGSALDTATVRVERLPAADIPYGALTPAALSRHLVAAETLFPDEALVAGQTRPAGSAAVGSEQIPPGAVSISVVLPDTAVGTPWPVAGGEVLFIGSPSSSGVQVLGTAQVEAIQRLLAQDVPSAQIQVALPVAAALSVEAASRTGALWLARPGRQPIR